MRALSTSELLTAWEQGRVRQPVQRALTLLVAACPEITSDELAELSIGQRDARLFTLREWTFGPQMVCMDACPDCGERLELNFDVTEIRVSSEAELVEASSLNINGYEIGFRPPNSLDIDSISNQVDIASARRLLLERCVTQTSHNAHEVSFDDLPGEVLDAVVEGVAQADPQADVRLALACPVCGHEWETVFDIVSFFWSEISAWAKRILREVHALASAYGWREADILSMSPWRRQFYLEMLNK